MDFRAWQMNPHDTVSKNVELALQNYMSKMGTPPQILECSPDVELPEGLQVVVNRIKLPNNILYVGSVADEQEEMDLAS